MSAKLSGPERPLPDPKCDKLPSTAIIRAVTVAADIADFQWLKAAPLKPPSVHLAAREIRRSGFEITPSRSGSDANIRESPDESDSTGFGISRVSCQRAHGSVC